MLKFYHVSDMDVENSGLEQNHTSFKPKTEYLGRRDYTTLKKDKKSLEKHTKTSLPLSNEGKKKTNIFLNSVFPSVKIVNERV